MLTFNQLLASSGIAAATELTVSSIANPTELNAVGTAVPDWRLCHQNTAASDQATLYRLDASTDAVNAPYIMASATAGLRWIAIAGRYQNDSKNVQNILTVGASLTVNSAATITGTLAASANLTVASAATITGTLTASSNLAVTSNATVSGTATITGVLTASSSLSVTSAASVTGVLTVSNATDATALGTGAVVVSTGGASIALQLRTGGNITTVQSGTSTWNNISTAANATITASGGGGNGMFLANASTGNTAYLSLRINNTEVSQTYANGTDAWGVYDSVNAFSPVRYLAGAQTASQVQFTGTLDASNSSTAGVTMASGLAVAKQAYIGTSLNVAGGFVKRRRYLVTGVNVNQINTDEATISNLPAKYRVISFTAYDASTSLTTATVDLRTATGGGGTALVSAAAMASCTAASKFQDLTLQATCTTDYQTATPLTIRNVTPQGSAATVSLSLIIEDLT